MLFMEEVLALWPVVYVKSTFFCEVASCRVRQTGRARCSCTVGGFGSNGRHVTGCSCSPQIAVVNNLLKLGLNELKLCFRVRLTRHLYDEYLK